MTALRVQHELYLMFLTKHHHATFADFHLDKLALLPSQHQEIPPTHVLTRLSHFSSMIPKIRNQERYVFFELVAKLQIYALIKSNKFLLSN